MIDALYPIMGGMISRYVTNAIKELMESINAKIDEGLSFDRYKRKLKAKISGVSETELLLEESADARIKALLVIEKETGLLIAAAQDKENEIDDPHIVASMASAIKDFVNDWMKSAENAQEVQLLSYGNATLYIESAGSVYLIAFLDAEPDHEQRKEINGFFAELVKDYSPFFQSFEGDNSAEEIETIQQRMRVFLGEQNPDSTTTTQEKESNGTPLKIAGGILALLLLGYLGYVGKSWVERHQLEKAILEKTGEHIRLEKEGDSLHLKGSLDAVSHFDTIKKILSDRGYTQIIDELYLPPETVHTLMKKQTQTDRTLETNLTALSHTIATQKKQFQVQLGTSLTSKFNTIQEQINALKHQQEKLTKQYQTTQQTLTLAAAIAKSKTYAINRLKAQFGENPFFFEKDGSLDFKSKNLFAPGTTEPNKEALQKLSTSMTIYIETLMSDPKIAPYISHIIIEGYTDTSGNHVSNMKLSQKRAEAVKDHLLSLPIAQQYPLRKLLHAKGMGDSSPVIQNGVEDKEASRRIKIRFELDDHRILSAIQKTLTL
jgi:outer membrane protein OmpA-like peptidoglycan-associated protein